MHSVASRAWHRVALSGDGKSLYAASGGYSAVARFRRDRDTGKLTYRGCISGEIRERPARRLGYRRLQGDPGRVFERGQLGARRPGIRGAER